MTTQVNLERPNLFDYATSELSQDAFLCWLLKWADPAYRQLSKALHEAGMDLIRLLSAEKKDRLPERITSVEVVKQYGHIDVLCKINEKRQDRTVILIEDKKGTQQHSNQLQRYKELVKEQFSENRILPAYVQTDDQSDYSEACKHGYAVIRRPDLLNCLEKHTTASGESEILDGFLRRLRSTEDDVQSWKETEPKDWSWNAPKGFYMELQSQPSLKGWWGYVANPRGGFLSYVPEFGTTVDGVKLYIHIENAKKLCFRIEIGSNNDNRKTLRFRWYDSIMGRCKQQGIPARKPARFGSGSNMTIAEVEQDYWLVVRDGRVDVAKTVEKIQKCLGVFRAI